MGREEFLKAFMVNFYLPQTIFLAVPNATIERKAYANDLNGGAAVIHVRMPKGSTLVDIKTHEHLDTVRAVLAFAANDRVFVVSTELAKLGFNLKRDKVEESNELEEQLIAFAKQVRYTTR